MILYIVFSSSIVVSTNFVEIFFSKESLKLFDIAKKFGLSNEIYIAKKGFNQNSSNELQKIAKELENLEEIKSISFKPAVSNELREYIQKNYYLLADFNETKPNKSEIKSKLKRSFEEISNSFYKPLNTYDPLEIFSLKQGDLQRYKLKNFGYMLKATTTINTSDAKIARKLYEKIKKIEKNHKDIITYAPFFFLVENSAYIKSDATKIMFLATILLFVLYFIILKNYKLLFNAILSIASSILLAILLMAYLFGSVNILALVFGVSITAVSVDYLFHYYFHGKFGFNKSVFLGFLTTFGVFFIFSFINIEIFRQIAVFSLISLSFSYIGFTYFFKYLNIKFKYRLKKTSTCREFNPYFVFIVSLLLLVFVYTNLEFDTDLKNLDYDNKELKQIAKMFDNSREESKFRAIIIEAKNKENLLLKYEKILEIYPNMLGIGQFLYSSKKCEQRLEKLKEFDFKNLKSKINSISLNVGFKEGTFKNSYFGVQNATCKGLKELKTMPFKIIKEDNKYYTLALVDKSKLKENKLYRVIDLAKTLKKDTKELKEKLEYFMFCSFVFIFFILLVLSKKEFLYPLVYLLFPMSVALFGITLLGKINIMHLFSLVILLAISIDYGIYMYNSNTKERVRVAIRYALMSTFFGFGVLVFSKTVAMFSIGFVITLGILSIFILLYAKMLPLKLSGGKKEN
jgi:predicted RND superfamily exporter protein